MIAAGRRAPAATGSGSAPREHEYDIRLSREEAESNEAKMASCGSDLLGCWLDAVEVGAIKAARHRGCGRNTARSYRRKDL